MANYIGQTKDFFVLENRWIRAVIKFMSSLGFSVSIKLGKEEHRRKHYPGSSEEEEASVIFVLLLEDVFLFTQNRG